MKATALLAALKAGNQAYAQQYAEYVGDQDLPDTPTLGLMFIACKDNRIEPLRIFKLPLGSAHVERTAGGRVTAEVIASVAGSQHLMGVDKVIVLHHTDCVMSKTTDEKIARAIGEHLGLPAKAQARRFDFHTIADPVQALRDDVEALRTSPFLMPGTTVMGAIYDVHTGQVAFTDAGESALAPIQPATAS